MKIRFALIVLTLSVAATPAMARYYHHHYYGYRGNYYGAGYNYGGPHYTVSDYYHNSRQLVGTR